MDDFERRRKILSDPNCEKGSAREKIIELESLGFEVIAAGEIKVDLDTPLETFLEFFGLVFIIAGVVLSQVFAKMGLGFPAELLVIIALGFGFIYKGTDNFFVIDINNRNILYIFNFPGISRKKVHAAFDEILGMTVSGCPMGFPVMDYLRQVSTLRGELGKNPQPETPPPQLELPPEGLWEYTPLLILKTGHIIQMCDSQKEALVVANRKAEILAELLNCPFFPCPERSAMILVGGGNGKPPTIIHRLRG